MKRSIIFILLIIICGCSSSKTVGNDLLNNYLKEKTGDQKIFIIRQKISPAETVRIFKGQTLILNGVPKRFDGTRDSIYDEDKILKMEQKYLSQTEKGTYWTEDEWQLKDFYASNITFIHRKEFPMEHILRFGGEDVPVFAFSQPLQYDNDHYIFIVRSGTTHDVFLTPTRVMVMYKEKGNWQLVEIIDDYISLGSDK